MHWACRVLVTAGLLASVSLVAQEKGRNVILPSPQLIHCRSAECSRLWKEESSSGGSALPAQIRVDNVNGEIVGLTAVYDKSVSTEEIRAAIDAVYGKSRMVLHSDTLWIWRVEPEKLVIQLAHQGDGESQLIYLKIGTVASLTPAAHIVDDSGKAFPMPTDFTGFWKSRCSDAWGVQIKKQTEKLFSVSFCDAPAAALNRERGRQTHQ